MAPPFAPSYGAVPGGGAPVPGQVIVTNPTALQPIAPSQAPCPAPSLPTGPPAPSSFQMVTGGGATPVGPGMAPSSGTGLLPTHPGLLSPALQQQAQQQALMQGQTGRTIGGQPGQTGAGMGQATGPSGVMSPLPGFGQQGTLQPSLPGLGLPAQGDVLQQMPPGLQAQLSPEGIGQLSIEEGFARFFILQGVTGRLKQFGYNFFDVQFSGFPPVMDTPVGPDYVLGPDDTLAVHIWNVPDSSFNRSYIAPVERDGTIFIPQVGAIPVAGTTFSQATRLIHARLGSLLKRFEIHISMARLRTIKVYVVGEVVRPGAYEVSSLATASHALYAACGPAKSGSLRHLQVVRDGKAVSELDFYQFFLKGDRTHDLRLQAGDTLMVPPIGPVAAIGGPVKRPAIYELKEQTGLTELVELAGGLTPTADRKRCQIFRVEAGQRRVILDVQLGDLFLTKPDMQAGTASGSDPLIQDGDFVRIAAVPTQIENAVSLTGAIRNPGPYEFRPGMRLHDLVTPEQMLVDSYMDRAELARTDPITYETTIIAFSPRKLFQGVPGENLELRRLDKITIATQLKPPRVVAVAGEIMRPGLYSIESGERLSSVLTRAGGLTSRAFPPGIIFVRESVRRSQQAEVEKFVALQKQKLTVESASLAAGALPGPTATAQATQQQVALQMQLQALDQLMTRLQPGRVVVKMQSLEHLEGSPEDLALEEHDQITVPQKPQTVSVLGAVHNPVSVVYQQGWRTADYLRQAGGMTSNAKSKEMFILRADGSTDASYAKLRAVGPGDTIIVPHDTEPKTQALPLWQAVASTLGSLMMGVAAISIISTR